MKNILYIALGTAFILVIPFVAMRFTDEVVWTLSDFVIAGVLLFGTGLLLNFVVRKLFGSPYRLIVVGIIVTAFVLTWAELAVGVFGTPWAGS